jgi:hypothetical protein
VQTETQGAAHERKKEQGKTAGYTQDSREKENRTEEQQRKNENKIYILNSSTKIKAIFFKEIKHDLYNHRSHRPLSLI